MSFTEKDQALAVLRFELRRLLHSRQAMGGLVVLLLPVVSAVLAAAFGLLAGHRTTVGFELFGKLHSLADSQSTLALVFRLGHLRWITFLAATGLFGSLYAGERTERTLHHAFLQPVTRRALTVGKYFAGVIILTTASFAAWLVTSVTWLLPHGLGTALAATLSWRGLLDLVQLAVVIFLASVAYGGLFTLAGAVMRSPPVLALIVLAWEGLCAFMPLAVQRFTIFYWLDSMLPVRVPITNVLAVLAEPAPWPLCVLVCLGVGVACVLGAANRAERMELAYGATE
jgi:ABC-type transport system involved in multi-copper enzyme maturation permease subunit